MLDSRSYTLEELAIAVNPGDRRRMLPEVPPSCRAILDVGGGAGQTLLALSIEGAELLVSLDPDPESLSLGRELSESIKFVRGRGESLPFNDDSFDLVISRVAIPYMKIADVLSEMARVTRPGGTLWATLHPFSMTLGELADHLKRAELKGAIYRLYILANGLTLHLFGRQFRWPFSGGRYESCQSSRGIARSLAAAGFTDIRIDKRRFFVVTARKAETT